MAAVGGHVKRCETVVVPSCKIGLVGQEQFRDIPVTLYRAQGNYAEAAPLYRRSLTIYEKALGPEHPHVATALINLAGLYQAQGNYAEAEPLFQRSLAIMEKVLGPDHPHVALSLNNLAGLSYSPNRARSSAPRSSGRASTR